MERCGQLGFHLDLLLNIRCPFFSRARGEIMTPQLISLLRGNDLNWDTLASVWLSEKNTNFGIQTPALQAGFITLRKLIFLPLSFLCCKVKVSSQRFCPDYRQCRSSVQLSGWHMIINDSHHDYCPNEATLLSLRSDRKARTQLIIIAPIHNFI